ncbi:MAG: AAA family ATPase [Dongiaceae bacterium]
MPRTLSSAPPQGVLLALLRTEQAEAQLRSALAELPTVSLQVLRGSLTERLPDLAAAPPTSVLLVDLDLADPSQLLALRKLVHAGASSAPVVVTAPSAGTEEFRQLMRLQIAEFLPQPMVRRDVVSAVEGGFRKLLLPREPAQQRCRVISVVRRAGGMGATFLAIQTAVELASRKRKEPLRVCLVDLDFQAGDTATYLDVDPRLDIAEIARAPQRLDAQLLQSMISHHPSGIDLLAAPPSLVEIETVSAEAITRLLDSVCEQYDFVVIDLPPSCTRWSIDVLTGSDAVLLVTRLAVHAIRQTKAMLARLRAEGIPPQALSVVVNGYRRGLFSRGVKLAAAEEALGVKADFLVADDPKLVSTALDHGQTLQEVRPRSRIEKQIREMVVHLLMRIAPDTGGPAPGRRSKRKG